MIVKKISSCFVLWAKIFRLLNARIAKGKSAKKNYPPLPPAAVQGPKPSISVIMVTATQVETVVEAVLRIHAELVGIKPKSWYSYVF